MGRSSTQPRTCLGVVPRYGLPTDFPSKHQNKKITLKFLKFVAGRTKCSCGLRVLDPWSRGHMFWCNAAFQHRSDLRFLHKN